ncbi:cation-translocating P-type ATPase [Methanobrevibacter curvatus]|uniref:cation-translocating P-type ATPase n=1 Tax=Methanobrevibacter curvatus TaxID=49547 RepID=UPI00082FC242|nr:cation-transporting P-type ATPase [Methanobrevibacter curvatus]
MEKILEKYNTSETGLEDREVEFRLNKYGENTLNEIKKDHPIKVFLMQFVDILIILLLIAAVAAYFIGDWIDSVVILIVVLINGIIGFIQEYRAEKAMEKLKSLISAEAVVKRNNKLIKIPAKELTIGDIVAIEEGDKIPADIILIESSDLKIDESSLTGESLPVHKNHEYKADFDLSKIESSHDDSVKSKIAYMDSSVVNGRGLGVVIAIGMNSSIGKIATMIQEADTETPLQKQIASLGKTLGLIAVVICVFVFILQMASKGFITNIDTITEPFMTAVSLAVAAVPEGLPAVLTLTLALGMQKMAKNNSIVRKLLAVETLGSCTVVCTDKTGTLTHNKMTVVDNRLNNKKKALEICTLCNNSSVKDGKEIGDPTDISVMNFAEDNNYVKDSLEKKLPRIKEIALDSSRKRMTTIHRNIEQNNEGKKHANIKVLSKGAPEIMLNLCSHIDNEGEIVELNEKLRKEVIENMHQMTNSALRVLGLAYKEINDDLEAEEEIHFTDEVEKDLIFAGLVGMMDPPRKEAQKAVAACNTAGIKVVMITGDHQETAAAIGREIGILKDGKILTGSDLDNLNDDEFNEIVEDVSVYARVFPEQKVRIVKALQGKDNIVSMTGDGVNDAPALKNASIGVAMGSGTDVAKEAADMIIQDDNFATIVKSVREGRKIYDNIKRFVKFQVSTNIGAILTIICASLMSLPIPFNPIQILWINIMMDGPPAQSLGVEGAEKNIMKRPPEKGSILNKYSLSHIVIAGVVMAIGTLGVYLYELSLGGSITNPTEDIKIKAMTIAFTLFVVYQIFNALNARAKSDEKNNFFWIAILASFVMQLLVVYLPWLQGIFRTTGLGIIDWVIIVIAGAVIFVSDKIMKKIILRG